MGGQRILILEDDPSLRNVLARVLRRQGYEVDEVGRGLEAVEAARSQAYDLVVTDIRMDGMDGLEALEQVQGQQPDVSSLVVTGYSTEADSIRAIRLGVGDYLKKPFQVETFLESVENIMKRRRQEAETALREKALSQGTLWVAEAAARLFGEEAILARAGRAAGVARAMGLPGTDAEDVRAATLVAGLRSTTRQLPEFLFEGLPPGLEDLTAATLERFDGTGPMAQRGAEIPLGARIAAAALAPEEALSSPLFDPEVVRLLREPEKEGPTPPEQTGEKRRGLLSLAHGLLEKGELKSAADALERVLQDGRLTREGVSAYTGLANIGHRLGRRDKVQQYAGRAVECAQQLGPTAAAKAYLECGLLLAQAGQPEGPKLLDRCVETSRELGLTGLLACGEIARCACDPGITPPENALEILVHRAHAPVLQRSLDWLLPYLLERYSSHSEEGVGRALGRLVVDFPGALADRLRKGQFAAPARLAAVRVVAASGTAHKPTLLEILAGDPDPRVADAARLATKSGSTEETPALMRIHSLGCFEVFVGEVKLDERDWKTRKTRYLMAMLVSREGRPVPEDLLIEAFWPDFPPDRARKNLYATTYYLRSALRTAAGEDYQDFVHRTPGGLMLNSEIPRWHDLEELEHALGPDPRGLDTLRRALELYRGPYLEGCYMDWALALRRRIEDKVVGAHRRLLQAAREAGRHHETVEHGNRLLELDACQEETHLAVAESYLALGRPDQALQQCESCQKVLRQELGAEPSVELLKLYHTARIALE